MVVVAAASFVCLFVGEGGERGKREIRMLENVLPTLFSSVSLPPAIASLWVGASVTGGRYTVPVIILVSTRRGTRHGVRVSYGTRLYVERIM